MPYPSLTIILHIPGLLEQVRMGAQSIFVDMLLENDGMTEFCYNPKGCHCIRAVSYHVIVHTFIKLVNIA